MLMLFILKEHFLYDSTVATVIKVFQFMHPFINPIAYMHRMIPAMIVSLMLEMAISAWWDLGLSDDFSICIVCIA